MSERDAAAEAWAGRVRARRAQADAVDELEPGTDTYAPLARRFGQDPERKDDLELEALLALASTGEVWLDIGAGGGRLTLPLARRVGRVIAVEPSPSMRAVLQVGARSAAIDNVDLVAAGWPEAAGEVGAVDVSLFAHVGYETEDMAGFIDAAERAARARCVAVMRESSATAPGHVLWPEIHGDLRSEPPMLPQLLMLLEARGSEPSVTMVDRPTWGYGTLEELTGSARRQLRIRAGSPKDERLVGILRERASERDGSWALDWHPMRDGVVWWPSPRA